MYIRWLGAALVVSAGSAFSWHLTRDHRAEEQALEQLVRSLDLLISELRFRATPLPELCHIAARQGKGCISRVFSALADAIETQTCSDGPACMDLALEKAGLIPRNAYRNLKILGQTLGQFDMEGQVRSLEAVKEVCQRDLSALTADREGKLRSFRALGICTGIALAIVLL